MTAPDHDGACALKFGPIDGHLHGLQNQPGARQSIAIPREGCWKVRNNSRLPFFAHAAFFNFGQVRRQQSKAMGCVPKQVTLYQHFGHRLCFVRGKAHGLKQVECK